MITDQNTALADELLPCPFCGGEASVHTYLTESLWTHDQVTYTKAGCDQCDVHFNTEPGFEVEALQAWNTRSALRPSPGAEAELVATLQKASSVVFLVAQGEVASDLSRLFTEATDLITRQASELRALRAGEGEYVVDPDPQVVGSALAKVVSYNDAHTSAVELGYPSLTEALEHLDELRAGAPVSPQGEGE